MMQRKTIPEDRPKFDFRYCPNCCYFLDGDRHVDNNGKLIFFPMAGFRHYRWSTGNMYDKIGYTTTCTCASGHERQRIKDACRDEQFYFTTGYIHYDDVRPGDFGGHKHKDHKPVKDERDRFQCDMEKITMGDFTDINK